VPIKAKSLKGTSNKIGALIHSMITHVLSKVTRNFNSGLVLPDSEQQYETDHSLEKGEYLYIWVN